MMKGSKTTLIIAGILILVCAAAVIRDMRGAPPKASLPPASQNKIFKADSAAWQPAPLVNLTGLNEERFTLEAFKGRVVLLNFWASWCPPCAVEFPSLLRLVRKYDGRVALVAVSNDEDKQAIYDFLKKFEGDFAQDLKSPNIRIVWDKDKRLSSDVFNTVQFPETILISKDGRMAKKVVGDIQWDGEEIAGFIDGLLSVPR